MQETGFFAFGVGLLGRELQRQVFRIAKGCTRSMMFAI